MKSPVEAEPDPALVRVRRYAPAKLNLTLAIVGRRDDGFHALHSVMAPLALSDVLALAPASGPADTLRISGLPLAVTPDNLVLRAIAAARDAVRVAAVRAAAVGAAAVGATGVAAARALDPTPPLAASLTKRIPIAAGLGGGSSDAAATVAAALQAWGVALHEGALRDLLASLGSDVPFFFAGGVALVTGRGELVEPLPDLRGGAPAVLLVTPRLPVSTAAVYAAYAGGARPRSPAVATSERLVADLRAGLTAPALLARAEELAAANDLLPAALSVAPRLAGFYAALSRSLGRPAGQSGSGPTAWVLYESIAGCAQGRGSGPARQRGRQPAGHRRWPAHGGRNRARGSDARTRRLARPAVQHLHIGRRTGRDAARPRASQ